MVELEIPPKSAYVGVVRLAVAALARSAGLDEERVDDLKIAVSEACANAVISHGEMSTDAPVTVAWLRDEKSVVVEVSDRVATYDRTDAEDDVDSQKISTRLTMSLALLKSLVDRCELVPRSGGGMCARLVMNI